VTLVGRNTTGHNDPWMLLWLLGVGEDAAHVAADIGSTNPLGT